MFSHLCVLSYLGTEVTHTQTTQKYNQNCLGGKAGQPEARRGWGVGEHAQSTLLTRMKTASLLTLYSKINRDQGKKRKRHQKRFRKV